MTSPMDALAQCPFCGRADPMVTAYPAKGVLLHRVVCRDPGCTAATTEAFMFKKGAIAAWNRRAPDAEVVRLREALEIARSYLSAQGRRDVDAALKE